MATVYKRYHKTIQQDMDKRLAVTVTNRTLAVDCSFKATRKMTQMSGHRYFRSRELEAMEALQNMHQG